MHVTRLVKRYPKRDLNAVDGLSFTVPYGEVFGLLGPNGAGKTTTVGVLTTRVRATSGSVRLAGVDVLRDPVAARARLAVVPQRSNLDRSLTPRQNLTFHAAYHGPGRAERGRRAARLLGEFGLGDHWYSGGMAQRLMIARSLMHEPAVLFLDEPTTGLDPHARLFVWNRIRDLRERGVTVVLTTHDMDEAAELADRVGIVDNGRLLALDTPASLIHGLRAASVLDLTVTPAPADDAASLLAVLGQLPGIDRAERVGDPVPTADGGSGPLWLRLYLPGDPAVLLGPVVAALTARSAGLTDVHIGAPSLEDVFIELTGKGLR